MVMAIVSNQAYSTNRMKVDDMAINTLSLELSTFWIHAYICTCRISTEVREELEGNPR